MVRASRRRNRRPTRGGGRQLKRLKLEGKERLQTSTEDQKGGGENRCMGDKEEKRCKHLQRTKRGGGGTGGGRSKRKRNAANTWRGPNGEGVAQVEGGVKGRETLQTPGEDQTGRGWHRWREE